VLAFFRREAELPDQPATLQQSRIRQLPQLYFKTTQIPRQPTLSAREGEAKQWQQLL